jgi:hypothetical protein
MPYFQDTAAEEIKPFGTEEPKFIHSQVHRFKIWCYFWLAIKDNSFTPGAIIIEYAEGGAKHILEIRQTPGFERKFDSPDDYIMEVMKR